MRGLVVLAASAAALLLAGAAPATALTGLEKQAFAKVQKARAAGRLDAAAAVTARGEIARAAHLIRTLPNGRAYHVNVALAEVASFSGALTQPRALALFGALRANDDYFAQHWAPADKTDIVGADGVVYRYFAGHCFRFHPLANFGVLNARATAGDEEQTRTLADALVARGVYQAGGGIAWEYDFPFGGGRAPWLSGMAQAVAAQAFARAAAVVPDQSAAYLREAQAAYSVIPRQLLSSVAAGPWIRLYSFDRAAVLNAQLQATISLQTYASSTGDAAAAALATRLQNAAAAMLPKFDTGYWSYYALPRDPSPVDYHKYVVQLLTKLSAADPRFASAATRFAAYEQQPPAFQLSNAGVGQVSFWLSKPATVTATTPAGPTKRVSLLDGWHTFSWSPSKAGIYPVHVDASDWLGNRTSFDALPIVRVGAAATKAAARLPAAASVTGQPAFLVGAALDDPSQGGGAQQLGLRLVRLGVAWPAGATTPDPGLVTALTRVPAGLQVLVELNVGTQPTGEVAQYAAALAQAAPALRYLVVTPAPTAAGAAAYAATLASIRSAVHAVAPSVAVGPLVDGALTPKTTVAALAKAQPQADVLAFRPALATTGGQWTAPNVQQLTTAFGGALPPLLIDGVSTAASVPPEHAGEYPEGTSLTGVTPEAQGSAYASAVTASACSPTVAGVVFDRLVDSATVPTAPTGLLYPGGVAKPAAESVSAAAAPAQRGTVVCPGLATPAAASTVTYPASVTSGTPVAFQLGCVRDCLYVATLVGADGRPVVARRGALTGGAAPVTVTLPKTSLGQASYTIDLRLASRVNPGTALVVTSPALPRQ